MCLFFTAPRGWNRNKVLGGMWRNLALPYWFLFLFFFFCYSFRPLFWKLKKKKVHINFIFVIYRHISYCNNKKEKSRWDFQSCNLESDRLWHPLLQEDHAALNWYSGRSGLTGGWGGIAYVDPYYHRTTKKLQKLCLFFF